MKKTPCWCLFTKLFFPFAFIVANSRNISVALRRRGPDSRKENIAHEYFVYDIRDRNAVMPVNDFYGLYNFHRLRVKDVVADHFWRIYGFDGRTRTEHCLKLLSSWPVTRIWTLAKYCLGKFSAVFRKLSRIPNPISCWNSLLTPTPLSFCGK